LSPELIKLGVLFPRDLPPTELAEFAREAEALGLDELWLAEDAFYAGGIAQAMAALGTTERVTVGIGILPVPVRIPAFAAMEIATIGSLYPGRLVVGFGHGITDWTEQVGAVQKQRLVALREALIICAGLLSGSRVDLDGDTARVRSGALVHPPLTRVPLLVGASMAPSVAIAGELADGLILPECSGPEFVRSVARQLTDDGRRSRHLVVYTWLVVDDDLDAARDRVRRRMARRLLFGRADHQIEPLGILPELSAMRESADVDSLAAVLPNDWIDVLALVGSANCCVKGIEALIAAGVTSVVLVPEPDSALDAISAIMRSAAGRAMWSGRLGQQGTGQSGPNPHLSHE
jgi:5,10-methylenetetrahydromethanopterin reductase